MIKKNAKAIEILLKYKIVIPFDDSLKLYRCINDVLLKDDEADNNGILIAYDMQIPDGYEIVSNIKENYVFDCTFDWRSLTNEQYNEVTGALGAIVTPASNTLSEYAPTKFENRDMYHKIEKYIVENLAQDTYISYSDLNKDTKYFEGIGVSPELAIELASNVNAKLQFEKSPNDAISIMVNNQPKYMYPINVKYLESALYNCGITGFKKSVLLNNKPIPTYAFFDLQSICDKELQENNEEKEKFEHFFNIIKDINNHEKINGIKNLSPSEAIKYAYDMGLGEYMNLPAGVWEGFTIAEHTETVLQVFEDSFSNQVPAELHGFIKYILLVHDIGKGYSKNFSSQKEANETIGKSVLEKMGFNGKLQDIILFIMSKSQTFTTDYYIRKNLNAIYDLENSCKQCIKEYTGSEVSDQEIEGLMKIAIILQTCDSAAYTRYAITRDEKRNVYHYNGNDWFTQSVNACGFGVPRISLKEPGVVYTKKRY